MTIPRIGWIGTGVMGRSMVARLLAAGYPVAVNTRTKSKAEPLIAAGAAWVATPAELAAHCDVIATMVGYPSDVEAVYLGPDGLLSVEPGFKYAIDFTTSEPELAVRIAEAAAARNVTTMDAPVSGGDVGAKNGTLSIMIGGGDEEVWEDAQPIFESVGKTIVHQGGPGTGQHTKMVNQTLIATNMIGVCEALLYAERAGLDCEKVLLSVSGGAAGSWSLSNLAPRMLKGDFDPGFFVEHFIKDMGIALREAERMKLDLPGLTLAKQLYERTQELGHGRAGTQALLLTLRAINGDSQ